jgi:hypothetical protein
VNASNQRTAHAALSPHSSCCLAQKQRASQSGGLLLGVPVCGCPNTTSDKSLCASSVRRLQATNLGRHLRITEYERCPPNTLLHRSGSSAHLILTSRICGEACSCGEAHSGWRLTWLCCFPPPRPLLCPSAGRETVSVPERQPQCLSRTSTPLIVLEHGRSTSARASASRVARGGGVPAVFAVCTSDVRSTRSPWFRREETRRRWSLRGDARECTPREAR